MIKLLGKGIPSITPLEIPETPNLTSEAPTQAMMLRGIFVSLSCSLPRGIPRDIYNAYDLFSTQCYNPLPLSANLSRPVQTIGKTEFTRRQGIPIFVYSSVEIIIAKSLF